MRRYATAILIILAMTRLYSSAPSDLGRVVCMLIAAILVGAVLFIGRSTSPEPTEGDLATEDDDDDADEELARDPPFAAAASGAPAARSS